MSEANGQYTIKALLFVISVFCLLLLAQFPIQIKFVLP